MRANGGPMLVIALVLLLPAELAAAYADDDSAATGTAAYALLAFVGLPWTMGALVATLAHRGSPPLEPYARTVPRLPALAVAGTIATVAQLLGALLLLLPGLLLAARWSASLPLIVVEGAPPFESLSRSNALVRGRTWAVTGALVVVLLVSLTVGAPGLVISLTAERPWAAGLASVSADVALAIPGAAFSYALYRAVRH